MPGTNTQAGPGVEVDPARSDFIFTITDPAPIADPTTPAPKQTIGWARTDFSFDEPTDVANIPVDILVDRAGTGQPVDVVFSVTPLGGARWTGILINRDADSDFGLTSFGGGSSNNLVTSGNLSDGTAVTALPSGQHAFSATGNGFRLQIYRDTIRGEAGEGVTFTLVARSNYNINPQRSTLTVMFTDTTPLTTPAPITIGFGTPTANEVTEPQAGARIASAYNSVRIPITRTIPSGAPAADSVQLQVTDTGLPAAGGNARVNFVGNSTYNLIGLNSDGSATNTDGTSVGGIIQNGDNANVYDLRQRVAAIELRLYRDAAVESDGTVTLTLLPYTNESNRYTVDGANNSVTITLKDNPPLGGTTAAPMPRRFFYTWSDSTNAYTVNGEFRVPETLPNGQFVREGDVEYHTYTVTRNSDSTVLHTVNLIGVNNARFVSNDFEYRIGDEVFQRTNSQRYQISANDNSDKPVDFRSNDTNGTEVRFTFNAFTTTAWKLNAPGVAVTNTDFNSLTISEQDQSGMVIAFPAPEIGWARTDFSANEPESGTNSLDILVNRGFGARTDVVFSVTPVSGARWSGTPGVGGTNSDFGLASGDGNNRFVTTGTLTDGGDVTALASGQYAFAAAGDGFRLQVYLDEVVGEPGEGVTFTLIPRSTYTVDPARSTLTVTFVDTTPPPIVYTWRIDTGSAASPSTARFEIIGTLTVAADTMEGDSITANVHNGADHDDMQKSANYVSHSAKIYDYTGGTRGSLLYDITQFEAREWFRYKAGSAVFDHSFPRNPQSFAMALRGTASGGTNSGDPVALGYVVSIGEIADTWQFNSFKDASGTDVPNFTMVGTGGGLSLARFNDDTGTQFTLTRRFEWNLGSASNPINGFGDTSGKQYYVIGEIRTQSTSTTTITQADAIYHVLRVYEDNVLHYTVDLVNNTVAIGTDAAVTGRTGGTHTFNYNTSTNRFVGHPTLVVVEGTGTGSGGNDNHDEAGIWPAGGGDYVIRAAGDSGLLVNTTGNRAIEGRELPPI